MSLIDVSSYEKIFLLNDLHAPHHHIPLLNAALDLLDNSSLVIFGGDVVQADEVSTYVQRGINSLQGEMVSLNQIMEKIIKSCMADVVWFPGNHEYRIIKLFNGKITFADTVRMLLYEPQYVKTVETSYVEFDFETNILPTRWRYSHPKNMSRRALYLPERIGKKHPSKNIIVGHVHLTGFKISNFAVGRTSVIHPRLLMTLGGLPDERCMPYKIFDDDTWPSWKPAFLVLNNKDKSMRLYYEQDSVINEIDLYGILNIFIKCRTLERDGLIIEY